MKEIIDKMLDEKKKNLIDAETYFNEHINDERPSAEYFDKFLKDFPRINIIDVKDIYKLIDESKLTKNERVSLIKYVEDSVSQIRYENYANTDKITELLDIEFDKYLLSQLFYTGNNKVKVYNSIRKLLDFGDDYVDIFKQFMDIQNVMLEVIDFLEEDANKYGR